MKDRIIHAVIYVFLAGVSIWLCLSSELFIWKIFFFSCGLSTLLLAVAYCFNISSIFLKKKDGRFRIITWLLFFPYLCFNYSAFLLFRRLSKKTVYTRISDNFYVGRRLVSNDIDRVARLDIQNVLDLTTEFPEPMFMRKTPHFLSIPVLDTLVPSLEDLIMGVEWLSLKVPNGPTYVHCVFGHGRAVVFVIAYLLKTTPGLTLDAAIAHLKEIRPRVDLREGQLALLRKYNEGQGKGIAESLQLKGESSKLKASSNTH